MLLTTYFQKVSDKDQIRQGDILKANAMCSSVDNQVFGWGVVVTADCDIAQGKFGDYYSYLGIVTAQDYLDYFWSWDELKRLRKNLAHAVTEQIYDVDRHRSPKVTLLSADEIIDWIKDDGPEGVVKALPNLETDKQESFLAMLKRLALTDTRKYTYPSPLARLRDIWKLEGKAENKQIGDLKSALTPSQMRSDYLMVPSLPDEKEVGFVVLLRTIKSISPAEIYNSPLDMKIKGRGGMHRIGRFADRLRYAIAQNLAILFSRIGMPAQFDAECKEIGPFIAEQYRREPGARNERQS